MEIYYKNESKKIVGFKEWEKMYKSHDSRHWEKGRSAYSLAKWICERDGEKEIENIVNGILVNDRIDCFEKGVIEDENNFDNRRNGRKQDLAISGKTKNGKKLFIAIEAKVDEEFNDTIETAYAKAKAYKKNHPSSQQEERIKDLCEKIYHSEPENVNNLRYQLFYYVAGSIAKDSDVCIMLVLVFKTELANDNKLKRNKSDFENFMGKFKQISTGVYDLSELREDGKVAFAVYKEVDLYDDSSHK
ncbi:MAG: hypothetical protein J5784_05380 [Muribaculaceae bacterium]|nr:hypothetical protein [Muribaculaceae bacterium]